jgi:hypothetical protein
MQHCEVARTFSSAALPVPASLLAGCCSTAKWTNTRALQARQQQQLLYNMELYWLPPVVEDAPIDEHAAFRISLITRREFVANTKITIRHCGVSWYNLFLDSAYVAEGPTRFVGTPYFDQSTILIPTPGSHVIAIHGHSIGLQSRILLLTRPFVACEVSSTDPKAHPISSTAWKCKTLSEYQPQWARMSVLLGWMENCTVSSSWNEWKSLSFDDSKWPGPTPLPAGAIPTPIPLAPLASAATSRRCDLAQVEAGTQRQVWTTVPLRASGGASTLCDASSFASLFRSKPQLGRCSKWVTLRYGPCPIHTIPVPCIPRLALHSLTLTLTLPLSLMDLLRM